MHACKYTAIASAWRATLSVEKLCKYICNSNINHTVDERIKNSHIEEYTNNEGEGKSERNRKEEGGKVI